MKDNEKIELLRIWIDKKSKDILFDLASRNIEDLTQPELYAFIGILESTKMSIREAWNDSQVGVV